MNNYPQILNCAHTHFMFKSTCSLPTVVRDVLNAAGIHMQQSLPISGVGVNDCSSEFSGKYSQAVLLNLGKNTIRA